MLPVAERAAGGAEHEGERAGGVGHHRRRAEEEQGGKGQQRAAACHRVDGARADAGRQQPQDFNRCHARSLTSRSLLSTASPTETCNASTTPSADANTAVCIFIASIIRS